MEEDNGFKRSNLQKYFIAYVGELESVKQGFLKCYGEVYSVHPKFVPGVVSVYKYYYNKLSTLSVSDVELREADQEYTVKGGNFGNVSWKVSSYQKISFQAVFICRKFSLRAVHTLNMFTDAWNYGRLRYVKSVQGFGSGPGMELRFLKIFLEVAGKRDVEFSHYDIVDWSAVGGAPLGSKCGKADMLLTSFVSVYLGDGNFPDYPYHLALEATDVKLEHYFQLNIGEMKQHDKFMMMQNTPLELRPSVRPRIVTYIRQEPFKHHFKILNQKEKEVKYLLSKAVGSIVDVGAGGFDITPLTSKKVYRYDVNPRDANTHDVMVDTDVALFNMSLHHMNARDIRRVLSRVKKQVLVREIDVHRPLAYQDAVHVLYEENPPPVSFFYHSDFLSWMKVEGWRMVGMTSQATSTLYEFLRCASPDKVISVDDPRFIVNRDLRFSVEVIDYLKARHRALCVGSLRPFNSYEGWKRSVACCLVCRVRQRMKVKSISTYLERANDSTGIG